MQGYYAFYMLSVQAVHALWALRMRFLCDL